MTDATITTAGEAALTRKVAFLTASDGEEWKPGLSEIIGVLASSNETSGTAVNASFSGTTVTINWTGMTDKKVTVEAIGRL